MIEIDLSIKDSDIKDLRKMDENVRKGLLKGVRNAMFYAEREAKGSFGQVGRLKVRTGTLRRSIQSGAEETKDGVRGWIGASVVYAAIHELGGTIRPRAAKYLHFDIDGDRKTVKEVDIPARPYLRPSIEDNLDEIRDIIISSVMSEIGDK